MKQFLMLFILFFWSFGNAQIITVKDSITQKPIQLVTILAEKTNEYSITNSDGEADVSKLSSSNKLIFQMLGYKKISISQIELQEKKYLVYLQPTNISLDQVVISSTKWNQPQKENPVKVTAIFPKDFEMQNPQTTADLLNTSGEVYIQKSQQGGGSPMIRGFATNRLLIAVDGVRMNTAIFRSGNLQNIISLDNFAFQNIEVLFGPGSVMYGSDAIGGVMSFYTLKPQFSLHDNLLIKSNYVARTSSANNEITGHADVNLGWKNLALLTSITYTKYGDLEMGNFGPEEYRRDEFVAQINGVDVVLGNSNPNLQLFTGYSQINLMQKISYKVNGSWAFDYGFHYSETSNYDRYDRLIRYKNDLPRSAEWYYGPQIWMMNNLTLTNSNANIFYDRFVLRLAHQNFEESRHDRDFQKTILYNRTEKVNAYSANFDVTKMLDSKNEIVYGFETVFNDVISKGTDENILTHISEVGPSRYPKSDWSSYAVYIAYKNRLTEKLILESGIRYSFYNLNAKFDTTFYPFPFTVANIEDGAFSGNIGLVYNPEITWTISGNISSGFRSPNVDDLGKVFDSEPGSVVVPNPNLKAEYAYNIDLGVAKIYDDFLKIDVTGFYTILENAMVRRDFVLNGLDSIMYDGEYSQVQAIQNAASAYVWGVQTGLELKFPYGIGLSARANYQKGEEELDDGNKSPIRHAAPTFGVLHLTYSNPKITADLYAVANGEISNENLPVEEKDKDYLYALDENGNPYSPSWYTLNLKLEYQLLDFLSVSGGVENITDQRYRPYSSGLSAAGRNYMLSVKTQL